MGRADGGPDATDAPVEGGTDARDGADPSLDAASPNDLTDGAPERAADANDAPAALGDAAADGGDVKPEAPTEAGIEAGLETGADGLASDVAAERISMPCMAAGACDPFDPASCGAQLCALGLDGNTTCVAAVGTPKAPGAACTTRNECGDGYDCVSLGGEPTTTCQRMCPRGSIGFCGGESRCTDFIVGCIQYCRLRDLPCDIYAQNCADQGKACSLSVDSETGARYTGCRPAGTAARGDRCDQGATCGKGLLCVREAGVSTCRQICTGDGGAVPCLAAGETCSGLTSTYQITYCR